MWDRTNPVCPIPTVRSQPDSHHLQIPKRSFTSQMVPKATGCKSVCIELCWWTSQESSCHAKVISIEPLSRDSDLRASSWLRSHTLDPWCPPSSLFLLEHKRVNIALICDEALSDSSEPPPIRINKHIQATHTIPPRPSAKPSQANAYSYPQHSQTKTHSHTHSHTKRLNHFNLIQSVKTHFF